MRNREEKIKVLQIAGGFRQKANGQPLSGGVTSMIYNYCVRIDNRKFGFDFLAIRNQCFEPYREKLEERGSNLYALDIKTDGIRRFFSTVKKLTSFLKRNQYDAVHINIGSFFPVLTCAIAAKMAGVKNIIAHSHSSGIYSRRKRRVINMISPLLTFFADQYCACSLLAAQNLFSKKIIKNKKYKIIRNAIDVEKFRFNISTRSETRSQLDLTNEIVVGHVGRFVEVKNHDFLVDFYSRFTKLIPDSKLLLVGDGDLMSGIQEKVENLGLHDQVVFAGYQSNPSKYYQAMDIFVMPSFLEGFPIVSVEAQSSGLPCYISTNITDEVIVTKKCKAFKLKDGPVQLATTVVDDLKESLKRENTYQEVIKAGYDISSNLAEFKKLYL